MMVAILYTGGKADEVGWGIYDMCRQKGAIIATGHEHSYCRTYLMNNFEQQLIASTNLSSPLFLK